MISLFIVRSSRDFFRVQKKLFLVDSCLFGSFVVYIFWKHLQLLHKIDWMHWFHELADVSGVASLIDKNSVIVFFFCCFRRYIFDIVYVLIYVWVFCFVCRSLAVGSRNGFSLFSLNSVDSSLEEIYTSSGEEINIVERLFSSSLVAVVSLNAPRKLKVIIRIFLVVVWIWWKWDGGIWLYKTEI